MIARRAAGNRAIVESDGSSFHRVFSEIANTPETRFGDLFATDDREDGGGFSVHAMFSIPTSPGWVEIDVALSDELPGFASLAMTYPALGWYEREIAEQFGIGVEGHPRLRRLTLPANWPRGYYPMRRDRAWNERTPFQEELDEIPALVEAPSGVVDYPLGPVRSGVVESAHYTLRTVGEELLDCALQLFYKHRGVEKRAEGLRLEHALLVAERVSGTSAFNNSLAFVRALEDAAAVEVPARGQWLRTLFGELERIYNHLSAFADLAQATGLAVAQAQFEMLKEKQLRLHGVLTGHRYLFGTNAIGGVACDLSRERIAMVRNGCKALREWLKPLEAMYLSTPSHVDRLLGTGILTPEDARLFGAVGPIARAAGIDRDLRRDHPYAAYGEVDFAVPLETGGDAMARTRVRFAEVHEAIRVVEQVCDGIPGGSTCLAGVRPSPGTTGFGWAESSHGETLSWVAVAANGTLCRYRVRPASFANWQAFAVAVPGHNILTDFPVIEQSFNLSVAEADR